MGAGADWLSSHSAATRVLFLFLSFAAAVATGWLIAELVYAASDLAQATATFAMLLTLMAGYKAWGAYVAATMTRRLFGGFFIAAMRFVFSRDVKDARTAMNHLREAISDKEEIDLMLLKLRERASVFAWLGLLFGAGGGVIIGIFSDTGPGFLASLFLLTVCGAAYGAVLTRLARAGLLLLPFQDN